MKEYQCAYYLILQVDSRPVGAFSKSSRPYRSRVSVCPGREIDFREADVGYGWGCVALPRALGLRLCEAQPRLDKFFAVRLCEFSSTPVRSGCPEADKHTL